MWSQDYLQKQINLWVTDHLQQVSPLNPITIHIDQLIGQNLNRTQWLPLAHKALMTLVDVTRLFDFVVQPSLIVALEPISNKFSFTAPKSVKGVEDALNLMEPPSLYLLNWERSKQVIVYEQVKVPLSFDIFMRKLDHVYVYYSEFRNEQAIVNDWEFARSIHADYYPETSSS